MTGADLSQRLPAKVINMDNFCRQLSTGARAMHDWSAIVPLVHLLWMSVHSAPDQ